MWHQKALCCRRATQPASAPGERPLGGGHSCWALPPTRAAFPCVFQCSLFITPRDKSYYYPDLRNRLRRSLSGFFKVVQLYESPSGGKTAEEKAVAL